MEKAVLSEADAICLDVEDGAAPDKKDEARSNIREFLEKIQSNPFKFNPLHKRILLRVNGLEDLEHLKKDIAEMVLPCVHSVFLPKVETAQDIHAFQQLIDAHTSQKWAVKREEPVRLIPILELPSSFLNAHSIAAASHRNCGLVFGHADYLLHTHGREVPEALEWPRNMLVLAARSQGLVPLDCGYMELTDHIGYEKECKRARNLGFAGKVALHLNQVPVANIAFEPTVAEIEWAKRLIETSSSAASKSLFVSDFGKMGGPPYVKKAKQMLSDVGIIFNTSSNTHDKIPSSSDYKPITGTSPRTYMPTYGLDLNTLEPGKRINSVLDLTVTQAMKCQWDESFFNANRLNCSSVVAQRFGLQGTLLPFSLMFLLCLGMNVMKFSENAVVYLGMRHAQYLHPCYPGDTLRCEMQILSYRNTSDGKASVVQSMHTLRNQHGVPVFRAFKATMFDPIPNLQPGEVKGAELEKQREAEAANTATLRHVLLSNARPDTLHDLGSEFPLVAGDVIVHRIVKVFGESEHRGLVTMLRVTNQHHINTLQFKPHEILVAGPLSVSASLGNSSHDLGHILDEQLLYTSNINKVNPGDTVGSFSYIVSVTPINEMLEEAVVMTIGVKNVNMDEIVSNPLPPQLFEKVEIMKVPKVYEDICSQYYPLLFRKIVCQTLRKIIRPRSFSANPLDFQAAAKRSKEPKAEPVAVSSLLSNDA